MGKPARKTQKSASRKPGNMSVKAAHRKERTKRKAGKTSRTVSQRRPSHKSKKSVGYTAQAQVQAGAMSSAAHKNIPKPKGRKASRKQTPRKTSDKAPHSKKAPRTVSKRGSPSKKAHGGVKRDTILSKLGDLQGELRGGDATRKIKDLLGDMRRNTYDKPSEFRKAAKKLTDLIDRQTSSTWKAVQDVQKTVTDPLRDIYSNMGGV